MAKEQFSVLGKGLITDIENCIKTNTTKAGIIEDTALTEHSAIAGRYSSSMSTIEGLGARALMSFLPPEEIQNLVNAIHKAENAHRNFISNDSDAQKSRLSAAKTEAALKGYALPVSKGGPYDEITLSTPFTDEEREIAFSVAKKSLLALSDKNIPSSEYVQKFQEEYSKILREDHPDLNPDKIALLEEYVSKGVVKKQGQNLPELEKEQIREAALKTREEFSKIFSSHKDKMLNAEPDVIIEENLQKVLSVAIERKLTSLGYAAIDSETRQELEQRTKEKIKLLGVKSADPDGVDKLAANFVEELSNESPRLIVLKSLKSIENDRGTKISESQAQKIVDKLSPALAQLDSEYLKKYSSVISGDIQKEILAKRTVTANIFGGVHIRESNLDKIADKLLDRHLDESDKYQIKIINDKLFGMKDSEVAAKLTDLGVEKAKASKYDVSLISDQDLAQMRKENPVQFDKVVFGKDNPVKNPKEVIDSVIDKAVDKLKTENGVKLSPEKEAYLRVKFKKELTPALSKLDPEYLKEQTDIISSNIQKDLYKNKSIGYSFGQEFSVATENLGKISENITANYQQSSNQFEVDKVKTLLIDAKKTNAQFEQSLTDLAVEKAKGVVFKPKDLNPENLLEMRKENPARFDKVVLGVGKEKAPIVASKRLSAVEQAKEISTHISHPKPPLAPPPLLHPHEQVQR